MKRAMLLTWVVVSAACRQPDLQGVVALWEHSPETLAFGEVAQGARAERTLTLHNVGRSTATLTLSAPDTLTLSQSALSLEAGATQAVAVTFRSTVAGPHGGSIEVRAGQSVQQVSFGAQVVPPAACPPPSPCQEAVVDAETGACGEQALPDGLGCALPQGTCGREGHCSAGRCVPAVESCSDENACTEDRCEPGVGCTHADVSSACAVEDPCRAAVCDAQAGCLSVPANEGGACGVADCTQAHVCRAGACVVEATEEGAACGPASPCQAMGHCEGQVCVRPDPRSLSLRWQVQLMGTSSSWLGLDGVLDAAGNFFWVEQMEGYAPLLRSVAPDGVERFRVRLDTGSEVPERMLVLGTPPQERLALSFYRRTRVQVRSTEDGALLQQWELDARLYPQLLPSYQSPEPEAWSTTGLVASADRLYALTAYNSDVAHDPRSHEGRGTFIVALEPYTGEVLWTHRTTGSLSLAVVDAEGNLFESEGWVGPVTSYSPAGEERFVLPDAQPGPLATHDGWLYLGDRVLLTDSGELVRGPPLLFGAEPLDGSGSGGPLISDRQMWALTRDSPSAPQQLTHASATSGEALWRAALEGVTPIESESLLLAEGNHALVFTDVSPDGWGSSLKMQGFDSYGQSWSCPLPPTSASRVVALGGELLYVLEYRCAAEGCREWLRAYALPGYSPLLNGWSNPDGNPGRALRHTW